VRIFYGWIIAATAFLAWAVFDLLGSYTLAFLATAAAALGSSAIVSATTRPPHPR
jgi:hypothetical protein